MLSWQKSRECKQEHSEEGIIGGHGFGKLYKILRLSASFIFPNVNHFVPETKTRRSLFFLRLSYQLVKRPPSMSKCSARSNMIFLRFSFKLFIVPHDTCAKKFEITGMKSCLCVNQICLISPHHTVDQGLQPSVLSCQSSSPGGGGYSHT